MGARRPLVGLGAVIAAALMFARPAQADVADVAPSEPSGSPLVSPASPADPDAPAPSAPTPAPTPAPAPTPDGTITPAAPVLLESATSEPLPLLRWRPNRPLLVTGSILFVAGYAPVAAVGAPSAAGLVGSSALILATFGIGCIDAQSGYVCRGKHGAIQLLIPIVGPVLFASNHPRDDIVNKHGASLPGVTKALLYASGGVQAAGILTLVSGLVFGRSEPSGQAPTKARSTPLPPSFYVGPLEAPGAVGVSVGASRW